MAYQNIWETDGVHRCFSEEVDGRQLFSTVAAVEADERFDFIDYVINDFSCVSQFSISEDELVKLAAIDRAAALSNSSIVLAVVAPTKEIRFWAELYGSFVAGVGYHYALFTNLEQAREWVVEMTSG